MSTFRRLRVRSTGWLGFEGAIVPTALYGDGFTATDCHETSSPTNAPSFLGATAR